MATYFANAGGKCEHHWADPQEAEEVQTSSLIFVFIHTVSIHTP